MRKIKLKKNRIDSMIDKIKFIIFKIQLRSNGIQIWNKNVEDLIALLQQKDEPTTALVRSGKLTTNLALHQIVNQRNNAPIHEQIIIANQAMIKAADRFEPPLNDNKISLISWWIRQELLGS